MSQAANTRSPQGRARAARMVLDRLGQHDSRWAAIVPISAKIGCAAPTLNAWG